MTGRPTAWGYDEDFHRGNVHSSPPVSSMIRLVLPLLLLGSCSEEGTVAAREALDKAGEAARILVEDIDLSAPIAILKEKAGEVVVFLTEQLAAELLNAFVTGCHLSSPPVDGAWVLPLAEASWKALA